MIRCHLRVGFLLVMLAASAAAQFELPRDPRLPQIPDVDILRNRIVDWDFESGRLTGWTAEGAAFANQPVFGNNVERRSPGTGFYMQGDYWIGTFENRPNRGTTLGTTQGDGPQGHLYSNLFEISRPYITFLIGGGQAHRDVGVELLVLRTEANRTRYEDISTPDGAAFSYPRLTLAGAVYFRLNSRAGNDSEVMSREYFEVSSLRGERARIRIFDNSAGPWGHINVDDFQFTESPPAGGPTQVRVTDAAGREVAGAEVFVAGILKGATDRSGRLAVTPPLTPGTEIIARQRIHEQNTYRDQHNDDSRQNWNYRIYHTNLMVHDDGRVEAFRVHDPAVTQEVPINWRNTLVGLNLIAAIEWDASTADMATIRDRIADSSQFLYNATDGQFFIEQCRIVDNAEIWDPTDFRVHGDASLRANVNLYRGSFLGHNVFGSWMNMSRMNGGAVYAHEFGHYGLNLGDEYADDQPMVTCTAAVRGMGGPFAPSMPQTSCMMWSQWRAAKLCSSRPENPHVTGTRQGDNSCWNMIAERYRDHDGGGSTELTYTGRWVINTPARRGAIPGRLPDLPVGWRPEFNLRNTGYPRLQATRMFSFVDDSGQPAADQEVWLRTTYGQNILLGKTSDAGRISVVGAHLGDTLESGSDRRVLGPTDFAMATRENSPVAFASYVPVQGQTGPNGPVTTGPNLPRGPMTARGEPFGLEVNLDPVQPGAARLTVTAAMPLAGTPAVTWTPRGGNQARQVKLAAAGPTAFSGTLTGLPSDLISLSIEAMDQQKRTLYRTWAVALSGLDPKQPVDVFSADGVIELSLPPGSWVKGSMVAIAPADAPPSNQQVVAGPYRLSGILGRLPESSRLRFRMLADEEQLTAGNYRLLRLVKGAWQPVPRAVVSGAPWHLVSAPIDELGTFVIVQ